MHWRTQSESFQRICGLGKQITRLESILNLTPLDKNCRPLKKKKKKTFACKAVVWPSDLSRWLETLDHIAEDLM